MPNNKKGVTLVELVVSIAVVFMIVAAGYSLLRATQNSYQVTSNRAISYLDGAVLSSYIEDTAKSATKVAYTQSLPETLLSSEYRFLALHIAQDNTLEVTTDGMNVQNIGKIDDSFRFRFYKLGENDMARMGFHYVFEANGKTVQGGTVLDNLSFGKMTLSGWPYQNNATVEMNRDDGNYLIFYLKS